MQGDGPKCLALGYRHHPQVGIGKGEIQVAVITSEECANTTTVESLLQP